MKVFVLTLSIITSLVSTFATAQTEVRRYNATAETGYGVLYRLPQTELEITAIVRQSTYTPGTFAPWAERYLSLTPTLGTETKYELTHIDMKAIGVPDPSKEYLVLFDKKTVAPFVTLTQDGIIYSINGQQAPLSEAEPIQPADTLPSRIMPALPKEYSLATSSYKQAEILAGYLYEVRESLMSIVTGNAEYLPKDGESMRLTLEQLRIEERRALRLFVGDTAVRYSTYRWRVKPELEDMHGRELCRFSSDQGVLATAEVAGQPLFFDLHIESRGDKLTEKEQKRLARLEGVVYNVPGTALVDLRLGSEKPILSRRISLPQVGTVQALSKRMFNLAEGANTAVYFDPITGEITSIRNE